MNNMFKKYFSEENSNITRGKRMLTEDIRKGSISRDELENIMLILEQKGFFDNDIVEKKPKEYWDDEYFSELSMEPSVGNYSRDLLEHMYEVAQYLNSKKRNEVKLSISDYNKKQKMVIVGVGVLIIITLATIYITK